MPGRVESPLDPAEGPVQRFAYELRKLRREAGGPTYRDMARKAPYATATLAQAAAGRKLPSLAVTLAYVAACGGDQREWERRWREAAAQRGESYAEDDGVSPYPGLQRFQPEDQERFFGRERLTAQLVELWARRLVAVVGASGSGKSSLLRAGLIPALRGSTSAEERPAAIRIFAPGPRPARTHGQSAHRGRLGNRHRRHPRNRRHRRGRRPVRGGLHAVPRRGSDGHRRAGPPAAAAGRHVPTGRRLPSTGVAGTGTPPTARSWPRSPATPTWSPHSRSAPTAAPSPPRPTTTWPASGPPTHTA